MLSVADPPQKVDTAVFFPGPSGKARSPKPLQPGWLVGLPGIPGDFVAGGRSGAENASPGERRRRMCQIEVRDSRRFSVEGVEELFAWK